ncbi:MAG: hypothetical protein U0263_15985 [Polyangiaceae bacterium]
MKRMFAWLALPVLTFTLNAGATETSDSGKRGHVTAYDAEGAMLDTQACKPKGLAHDYFSAPCGQTFRAKVKANICSTKGKGKHRWYYRVSDRKTLTSQTAICK